jgi:hypothetical protein
MAETFTGGCACGSVRYRLTSLPFDAGWCHCRICQLTSGAPAMAFASVPEGHMEFTQGGDRVKRFKSSSFGHRLFCGDCGTPFAMKVDHQPETVDFSIATLDDPGQAPPGFHIFYATRVPWFETADDLPRHDRFRPDTRGLQGTMPREG